MFERASNKSRFEYFLPNIEWLLFGSESPFGTQNFSLRFQDIFFHLSKKVQLKFQKDSLGRGPLTTSKTLPDDSSKKKKGRGSRKAEVKHSRLGRAKK